MSRIGKKPVPVPDVAKVRIAGATVEIEGPRGKLVLHAHADMKVTLDEGERVIRVERPSDQKRHKALHGLTRALIANMVIGVIDGYAKTLEMYGTGYSVSLQGRTVVLTVGFANAIRKELPEGLALDITTPTSRSNAEPAVFTISGCDKQLVGEFAAEVRHLRPPEPYGGKGIRYKDEQIRRKAGKAFTGGPT
ncbi:MAG: 50S ribosomal protein L6 [Planctomycetia bacterium]|nr:50S ribosomal protein L6 [Planctomycetia bacterium]